MAKGISGSTPQVRDDLHTRLSQNRGGGQPLPEMNRNFMERRFGADFSGVRVHTDSDAVQMNRELNAQAFTHRRDIYFGAGRYAPDTVAGKLLLAHELAHVMQQTGDRVQRRCPPATRDVSQMTVLEKWCVALLEAIRPFVEELRIIIICLLIFVVAATFFTAYVMPVLALIIPAVVIEVVTGLIAALGLTLAVYFVSRAVETGTRAWGDLNQAIQNATTYPQLADAGRLFGRRLAQLLGDLGLAYLGLRALIRVRGYRATAPSRPRGRRPAPTPTPRPTPTPTPTPRPSLGGDLRTHTAPDVVPAHLATAQRTVSAVFRRLGGLSRGYRIAVCDDATAFQSPHQTSHFLGRSVDYAGGALTDVSERIVWVHVNTVTRGGLVRSWGSRLNLNQIQAHELGHAQLNGGSCADASRLGAGVPGLSQTERAGLLHDSRMISQHLAPQP